MAQPIDIHLTDIAIISIVTGIGGWFANTFFCGKSKPPKPACANCPYHEDHERRIRVLEANDARTDEAILSIRDTLHNMQETLNAILLRVGGAQQ